MAKFDNPLNNLKIASPCSQDWNAMVGSDRKRYCGECKLNVYNLSDMTKAEAENLLMNSEGRLCVRYYKRADGTVLTQDCPVGWAKVKNRTKAYLTAVASLIFTFFGALGLVAAFKKEREITTMGAIPMTTPPRKATPKNTPEYTMGNVAPKNTPEVLMGDVSMGTPAPSPKTTPKTTPKRNTEDGSLMGKVSPVREN